VPAARAPSPSPLDAAALRLSLRCDVTPLWHECPAGPRGARSCCGSESVPSPGVEGFRATFMQIGAYILAGFYGPLLALFFSINPA
jgi:hypothetical protein